MRNFMNFKLSVYTVNEPFTGLNFTPGHSWRILESVQSGDSSFRNYQWFPFTEQSDGCIDVYVGKEQGIYRLPIESIIDVDTSAYRELKSKREGEYLERLVADIVRITRDRTGIFLPTSFTGRIKREGFVVFDEMLFAVVDKTEGLDEVWKSSFGLELIRKTKGRPVYRTLIGADIHSLRMCTQMSRLAYALTQRYGGAILCNSHWCSDLPNAEALFLGRTAKEGAK